MGKHSSDYDIVLFGATGFAGALTAEYLARHAPDSCRWALAGRNLAKLEAVRASLAEIDPRLGALPLVKADVTDAKSVREVAESTRTLITTVGPYVLYGDPAVAACAAAGTDYLDLTGEPEFVDRTYVKHHATAERSGARLISAAGFDSIPHDLGAYFTVLHLPENVPITIDAYVRASAMFSGGTFHSAVTAMSRPLANIQARRQRHALETRTGERAARIVTRRPHRSPSDGRWAVPMPTVDPQIVTRSALALARYGPDFAYSHNMSVGRLPAAAGLIGGIGVLAGVAQIPPARRALLRIRKPGEGPSPERRNRSWFTVTFIGTGGGERVVTRVSGGDPGYDETAKMLAESALCLVLDELPETAGQVTTVEAMGDALLDRLQKASIAFDVIG